MGDEYGDDFEVETSQPASEKPSKGLSLLRSAAVAVDKEEREATAAALERGAAEMKGVATLLGKAEKVLDESLEEGKEEAEDEEIELFGDEDLDFELNSSLRQACNKGNLTSVKSVVSKGANVKARDRHGWTSLHWAAKGGSSEIVDYLADFVESGDSYAFINAKDSISGWTALMIACMGGHVECVRSLISRGAKAHASNLLGEAASDFIDSGSTAKSKAIKKLLGIHEKEESKEGSSSTRKEKEREEK
jgi:hypothetical protein